MAKRKTNVVSDYHVLEALTIQLRCLCIIDDDAAVTSYKKVPEGIEVVSEKVKDD